MPNLGQGEFLEFLDFRILYEDGDDASDFGACWARGAETGGAGAVLVRETASDFGGGWARGWRSLGAEVWG
jgi:hypothetical protein